MGSPLPTVPSPSSACHVRGPSPPCPIHGRRVCLQWNKSLVPRHTLCFSTRAHLQVPSARLFFLPSLRSCPPPVSPQRSTPALHRGRAWPPPSSSTLPHRQSLPGGVHPLLSFKVPASGSEAPSPLGQGLGLSCPNVVLRLEEPPFKCYSARRASQTSSRVTLPSTPLREAWVPPVC